MATLPAIGSSRTIANASTCRARPSGPPCISNLSAWTPPEFSVGVVPGTYDLVYRRGTSSGEVFPTHVDDPVPTGWRVLNACVEVL